MKRKQWITGGATLVFILGTLYMSITSQQKQDKCLQENPRESWGTVKEIVHYKGKNVKIYFTVNGKRYLASETAYDAGNPVKVGDKFPIQYCEEDPSMNRILFDKKVPH
jgi:hypothetical protein